MLDYIDGYYFSEIAHFRIDRDNKDLISELFKQNAIIFCKTDYLLPLFNYIKLSKRKYILITHMSDYPITSGRFNMAPPCIVKWFAENAIYDNINLISIPIGLGNHKGGEKSPTTNHDWFCNNIEQLRKKTKITNKLYCNWAATNLYRNEILQRINFPYHWEEGIGFEQYCENMSNYKYVICPPGNGVDTHRLWEALYMDCVPIVLKHRIYRNYDLPIIQINNWEEITSELLEKSYTRNTEELYMTYWKKIIIEEFNKINK